MTVLAKQPGRPPRWPIWALLWRMLAFGFVLMPLGLVFLFGAIVALAGPLVFAAHLCLDEHYLAGLITFALWLKWAPVGWRLVKRLTDGVEYSGL